MSTRSRQDGGVVPPKYVVDLSLPPRERYKTIATQYKAQLDNLTSLFDQLLLDLGLPQSWLSTLNRASALLLRKLHDEEQNEELRGIADETGISMYLLVAFNVVLDLLMGCTSGAVRSLEADQPQSEAKMLHFRCLDWDMNPLRHVIVQLDFIRSKSIHPEKVIASSITYVGFLGVLTGVKPGLSVSLNFRPIHNATAYLGHFRFYFHHLLVLLGHRPSIASLLRSNLLKDTQPTPSDPAILNAMVSDLEKKHTTAAYIILSDGKNTITLDKDFATASMRQSSSFIAVTNHDVDVVNADKEPTPAVNAKKGSATTQQVGMVDLLEDSAERLQHIEKKWKRKLRRVSKNRQQDPSQAEPQGVERELCVTKEEMIKWICDWPTTNESTHFAAILDPSVGQVLWCRAYPQPLQEPH